MQNSSKLTVNSTSFDHISTTHPMMPLGTSEVVEIGLVKTWWQMTDLDHKYA